MRTIRCNSLSISAALLLACVQTPAWAGCPPQGASDAALVALKGRGFEVADARTREALAFDLVACLASPDPSLRDGIAYEGLQHWLRARAMSPETLRALRTRLFAMLDAPDPLGVARPFAALMLAEVARTDRVAPWMRDDERAALVERAARYLESVGDYRGFDAGVGWRHGVAHGADWAMQLAMNPALDRAQLDRLLQTIAVQAIPASGHAYVFGEYERLARPLLLIAKRDLHSEAEWSAWFAVLPPRLGEPASAWKDEAWLARRHDLAAFLHVLYIEIDLSEDPGIARMKPGVLTALKELP